MKFFRAVLILCMVVTAACKEFPNPFAGDRVLARVGDQSLLAGEVEHIFTEGLSPEDSLKLLESYVDKWVKQQLKNQEAKRVLAGSADDIEALVDAYRNSLLGFRLDQYIVDRTLDTTFTDKEIADYYADHRSDFALDRTIVKGKIVKFPDSYRQKKRLKDIMASVKDTDAQDLADICAKNNFELSDWGSWVDFSDFLSRLPVDRSDDHSELLSDAKVHEFSSGDWRYYAIVTAVRRAGDLSPAERERDVIVRILYNQRQSEIIRRYEDSIYRAAVAAKRVVINVD